MSAIKEFFKENVGRMEFDPQTVHHFSQGLYARQMHIPKDFFAVSHSHNYDHLSILAKGRVIVKTDEYNTEYAAPACIEIKAGIHHMIIALEDSAWFCIHATDETDPEKVDEVTIKKD